MRPDDKSYFLSCRSRSNRHLSLENLEKRIVLDSGFGVTASFEYESAQAYYSNALPVSGYKTTLDSSMSTLGGGSSITTWRLEDENIEVVEDDYDPVQYESPQDETIAGLRYPQISNPIPHTIFIPWNGGVSQEGSGMSGSGMSGSGMSGSGMSGSGMSGSGMSGSGMSGSGMSGSDMSGSDMSGSDMSGSGMSGSGMSGSGVSGSGVSGSGVSGSGVSGSGVSGSGVSGSGVSGSGVSGSGVSGSGVSGSGTSSSGGGGAELATEEIIRTNDLDATAAANKSSNDNSRLSAIEDRVVLGQVKGAIVDLLANDIDPAIINFTHRTLLDSGSIVSGTKINVTQPRDGVVKLGDLNWKKVLNLNSTLITKGFGAESRAQITGLKDPVYLGRTQRTVSERGESIEGFAIANYETEISVDWVKYIGGTLKLTNKYGTTYYRNLEFIVGVDVPNNDNARRPLRAGGKITIPNTPFLMELDEFDPTNNSNHILGSGFASRNSPTKLTLNSNDSRFSVKENRLRYSPNADTTLPQAISYEITNQFGEVSSNRTLISSGELIIYDSNNVALPAKQEVLPGMFILKNDDDDNRNGTQDLTDATVNGENDLLRLEVVIKSPRAYGKDEYIHLDYDPDYISIWTNSTKVDSNGESTKVIPGITKLNAQNSETKTLWIEGLKWGSSTIDLRWQNAAYGTTLDTVKITVVGIDLDVDSDNNGTIEHSDWEEYLEDHDLALGMQVIIDRNREAGVMNQLHPVSIQLPKDLDPDTLIEISTEAIVGGDQEFSLLTSELVEAYRFTRSNEKAKFSIGYLGYDSEKGTIDAHIQGHEKSIPEKKLDYKITAEIVDEHTDIYEKMENDKVLHDKVVKPDYRIRAKLLLPINGEYSPDDVAKIMVVQTGSFYHEVQSNKHLRMAAAADVVYADKSIKNNPVDLVDYNLFGLRFIPHDEVLEYLDSDSFKLAAGFEESHSLYIKSIIIEYLYGVRYDKGLPIEEKARGLKAGLYQDLSDGSLILSFRGTETRDMSLQIDDWIENIQQAANKYSQAYSNAAKLAWALNSTERFHKKFTISGHSLGGGLASYAGSYNHIETVTFNAAGVWNETFFRQDGNVVLSNVSPDLTGKYVISYEVALGSEVRGHTPVINAPDILTLYSRVLDELPDPLGATVREIEGLYDIKNRILFDALAKTLVFDFETDKKKLAKLIIMFALEYERMLWSHNFPSIYYGLLHSDDPSNPYNIYDDSGLYSR